MQHIDDAMVDALVSADAARETLLDAFRAFGAGSAAMQERYRTEAAGVKLSTLGAVLPGQGVAGAKVYTTIAGRFTFVILLFSTETGAPLASFDAGAITRLRTAACSVIAARLLARPESRRMALFGAGEQGLAHVAQMAGAFDLQHIAIVTRNPAAGLAERLSAQYGLEVRLCDAAAALDGVDIVVTASRSAVPLFSGELLEPGSFVAAVGSSLPHTRELDDVALRRSALVAVEWRKQSLREAGDLVLAAPDAAPAEKIVELGELLTNRVLGRRSPQDIMIYKSVGVGLEDIALAGLAWRRLLQCNAGTRDAAA